MYSLTQFKFSIQQFVAPHLCWADKKMHLLLTEINLFFCWTFFDSIQVQSQFEIQVKVKFKVKILNSCIWSDSIYLLQQNNFFTQV